MGARRKQGLNASLAVRLIGFEMGAWQSNHTGPANYKFTISETAASLVVGLII